MSSTLSTRLVEIVNEARRTQSKQRPLLVCVGGVPGSGKTTIVSATAESLNSQGVKTSLLPVRVAVNEFFVERF